MPASSARVDPIIASFASIITPRSRIIDIGAGKGLLAQEMARRFSARVTLVDVAQYNQTDLPLTICDSRALAFADHSFDFALLSFVLHHSPNPDAILREALRAAREVIVIENDVRGKVRGAVTRLIDSLPAIRYGTPPCYIARTRDEWLAWLAQLPVETRVLSEFGLEYGFFRNLTVHVRSRANAAID
ncbi:MAG: class I SAM-dependent methyltransferase [Chloroflexota bacterium]|nr:class I SAM-dependent methyltransferase [Chloroflexota bacterium]